jgi:hypothetical protein
MGGCQRSRNQRDGSCYLPSVHPKQATTTLAPARQNVSCRQARTTPIRQDVDYRLWNNQANIHVRNFEAIVYTASMICHTHNSECQHFQNAHARHTPSSKSILPCHFLHTFTSAYHSTCPHFRSSPPPSSHSQSSSSPSPPSPSSRCASAPRTPSQTATPRYPPCSSPPLPSL